MLRSPCCRICIKHLSDTPNCFLEKVLSIKPYKDLRQNLQSPDRKHCTKPEINRVSAASSSPREFHLSAADIGSGAHLALKMTQFYSSSGRAKESACAHSRTVWKTENFHRPFREYRRLVLTYFQLYHCGIK